MNGDTTTIRFPAIAELEVDSFDRYTNSTTPISDYFLNPKSSANIIFNARQSLLFGQFNRIAVSEFNLQWRTPNINPRNNTFFFEISGGSGYAVQLSTGFYDISGLATNMADAMNLAVDPSGVQKPFTASLINLLSTNPDSEGIQISSATAWRFAPPTIPSDFKFYRTAGINSININFALKQTFALTTDLAYTHYVDMVSNRLSKFSKVKDNTTRQQNGLTNVLVRIFLTPFNNKERFVGINPYTMAVDYTTPKQIRWNPDEQINEFDLILYDEYGDELFAPADVPDWNTEQQFTLQASET